MLDGRADLTWRLVAQLYVDVEPFSKRAPKFSRVLLIKATLDHSMATGGPDHHNCY